MSVQQIVATFGGFTVLLVLLLCIMIGVLVTEIEGLIPGCKHQTTQQSAVMIHGSIPQTVVRSTEHFWYERKFPRGDCTPQGSPDKSFFGLKAIDINGKMRNFDEFSGKVLLVTNVASY